MPITNKGWKMLSVHPIPRIWDRTSICCNLAATVNNDGIKARFVISHQWHFCEKVLKSFMKFYDPEKRSNLNTDSFEELDMGQLKEKEESFWWFPLSNWLTIRYRQDRIIFSGTTKLGMTKWRRAELNFRGDKWECVLQVYWLEQHQQMGNKIEKPKGVARRERPEHMPNRIAFRNISDIDATKLPTGSW